MERGVVRESRHNMEELVGFKVQTGTLSGFLRIFKQTFMLLKLNSICHRETETVNLALTENSLFATNRAVASPTIFRTRAFAMGGATILSTAPTLTNDWVCLQSMTYSDVGLPSEYKLQGSPIRQSLLLMVFLGAVLTSRLRVSLGLTLSLTPTPLVAASLPIWAFLIFVFSLGNDISLPSFTITSIEGYSFEHSEPYSHIGHHWDDVDNMACVNMVSFANKEKA